MADRGRFEACAALCTQRESVRSTGGGGDEFALVHDCARIAESWINAQGVAQNVVRTPPARRCKEAKLSTNSTPAIQEGSHTHKRPADGHSLAHLLSCSHAESRIFRTRRLSDCASGATMDVAVGTGTETWAAGPGCRRHVSKGIPPEENRPREWRAVLISFLGCFFRLC